MSSKLKNLDKLDKDFEVRIGPHFFKVLLVDKDHPILGGDHHGFIQDYVIYINKDDPYTIRLSTFFHEMIHAIEAIYEIKISHKDLNITADVIAQIMLDNFIKR